VAGKNGGDRKNVGDLYRIKSPEKRGYLTNKIRSTLNLFSYNEI